MEFLSQCKGKGIDKLPKKTDHKERVWAVTTKYDGNYVQIHITAEQVRFYTSGGKQFYDPELASVLKAYYHKLPVGTYTILEAEYIGTDGKLGDRVNSSTGSYRSNFTKGKPSNVTGSYRVFNRINNLSYSERYQSIVNLLGEIDYPRLLPAKTATVVMSLQEASTRAKKEVEHGWEGVVATRIDQLHQTGKRVNSIVKIKYRPTVDLRCIDVEEGEGKYVHMIGSLILEDSEGRVVAVGSGLSDSDRIKSSDHFVGHIVEISYEQILDTYVQPVFERVRYDKAQGE